MVTLRAHSVGRLRGMNLLPASFRKFIEVLSREMRWMPVPFFFNVFVGHFTVTGPHSILLLCIWELYLFSFSLDNKPKGEKLENWQVLLQCIFEFFSCHICRFSLISGQILSFAHFTCSRKHMIALHLCTLVTAGVNSGPSCEELLLWR